MDSINAKYVLQNYLKHRNNYKAIYLVDILICNKILCMMNNKRKKLINKIFKLKIYHNNVLIKLFLQLKKIMLFKIFKKKYKLNYNT